MRARAVLLLAAFVAVLALTGLGGSGRTPEQVVRAWSRALNADDNKAAGALFAPGAVVIQGSLALRLPNAKVAALWNSGLPCAGHITELRRKGDTVTATFRLGTRPHHRCAGANGLAAATFTIKRGKITRWQQVQPPPPAGPIA